MQDEIIDAIVDKEYRREVSKRMKNHKKMDILAVYNSSIFQDFECFRRTEVDLVVDDFILVLDEYNSSFITYELQSGIYTFEDLSEAVFSILQPEYEIFNNSIDIEFDDIIMKTKLVVRTGVVAIRFDGKSFLPLSYVLLTLGLKTP